MSNKAIQKKVKKWVTKGKDPRSAHWQGALENILKLFKSQIVPGRLIPVGRPGPADAELFEKALAAADLSPGLPALFICPDLAADITPPDAAEALHRVEKGGPSCLILIARPGKEMRLLCAEISAHAHRPGVDLFQEGAFLGNYDYDNQADCLAHLNKIIRAHVWEKGSWTRQDYMAYTLNWFEKFQALDGATVAVEKDFSYFHSPTLIKGDELEALFILLTEDLTKRSALPQDPFGQAVADLRRDKSVDLVRLTALIEEAMVARLNLIRVAGLVEFGAFSNARSEQFKRGFEATVRRLEAQLAS